MLSTGQCYRRDITTDGTLLPKGHCYRWDIVTDETLLPTGHCYRQDIVTDRWGKGRPLEQIDKNTL